MLWRGYPVLPILDDVQIITNEMNVERTIRPLKAVNEYVLLTQLGNGAFSKVFLGYNYQTHKKYAIKRIKLSQMNGNTAVIAQLEREIRLMRSLCHENIVKMHEVLHDNENNIAYIVLDHSPYGSFQDILNQNGPLSQCDVISMVKQVALALEYVHSQGIVHQDIKPANILLMDNGHVVVSDFGIGHSFQSSEMVIGSPAYQAPEVLRDDVDFGDDIDPAKEDVWALGVTAYQLLFNRLPYNGSNLFEIVHNIKEVPLKIPECSPSVLELLRGMLNTEQALRWSIEDILSFPIVKTAKSEFNLTPPFSNDISFIFDSEPQKTTAIVCDSKYSFVGSIIRRPTSPFVSQSTPVLTTPLPFSSKYGNNIRSFGEPISFSRK